MSLVQSGSQQLHQRADLGLDASTCKKKAPACKQFPLARLNADRCLRLPWYHSPLKNHILESTPTVMRLVQKCLNSRLSGQQEVCEGLPGRALLQEHYGAQGLGHSLVRHSLAFEQHLAFVQNR